MTNHDTSPSTPDSTKSVSLKRLNPWLGGMLTDAYTSKTVVVQGQVRNLYHSKKYGHYYFTLYEDRLSIDCVWYSSRQPDGVTRLREYDHIKIQAQPMFYIN